MASTSDFTHISLRDVQVFLVLAERRSITTAAKDLNLTQSGMSRAIQGLEATVGLALFERTRQGLVLTDGGAAFMGYAKRMAQSYAEAVASVQVGRSMRLTLATCNIITPLVLPALLHSAPQAQAIDGLVINEMASHRVLTQVLSGAADLGLCMCTNAAQQNGLDAMPLLSAPLGLLAGAGVQLPQELPSFAALGLLTRPPHLPHSPHLQFSRLADDMVLPQALRLHSKQHGVQFDAYFAARIVSNNTSALFSAIAGGQLVTLVSAIAAYSAPQPLQFLPLPHLLPALQLCVVGRQGSNWRQKHGAWVDAIVASVQSVAWPANITRLPRPAPCSH